MPRRDSHRDKKVAGEKIYAIDVLEAARDIAGLQKPILGKHAPVSEEDFAKDPVRNRFSILPSQTQHLSSDLGQTSNR
jgi:hypothetical protein